MNAPLVHAPRPAPHILLPGEGLVRVSARPHPMRVDRIDLEVEAGRTLEEIVALAIADPARRRWVHIWIAGNPVPREHWRLVRPKPDTLVEIAAELQGGGGGEKSPMRTILTIAVIAAAAYTGGLSLGTIGVFGTQVSVASLAAGAISLAGGMLVNAIAPPSRPKAPEISNAGSRRESPTYDIAGARNTARPFGVVKRVLGEHLVAPDHGARPYTEFVGENEYLRMLLVWSIGPVTVTDRKIGETALEEFDDVETEFRRGYQPSQLTDQGNWDASSGSYPSNPSFGDWYTVTVAGTIGGVAWGVGDTLVFNGLAAATSSTAWDRNGNQPLTLFSNTVVQEDLAVALTFSAGAQTRTTEASIDEISVDIVFAQGLVRFAANGNKTFANVQIKIEYRPASGGAWSNAPGLTDGVLTASARRASAVRTGHRWAVPNDRYEVRLTRITADASSEQVLDVATWSALRSITASYPISTGVGLAVEAVRIRATGQLAGVIDQYTGVVQSIVPDWDDDEEAWVTRATRNPASLYRAVCQDAGQSRPQADAALDLDGLQAWHELCNDRGYRFDAVLDFAISTRELLQDIASAGCARVARPAGLWSVVTDTPKAVVQHFTPRNSWGFSGSKVFLDLPHALRVRFVNRELDWSDDERVVYRDGYGPSNATEFEQFEQFGVTDPVQIWRRAREHFASAVLRPERYSLMTDVAWLVANDGDAIRVSHDVMLVGLASGRIKEVLDDGTDCTGLVIDELLEMETAKSYVLRVQHVDNDGTVGSDLLSIDTETGGVTEVTLSTPIPLADAPSVDDLVLFGEAGTESIEGVIVQIRPRADLSAQIVFVDAAREIAEAASASREFVAGDVTAGTDTIAIEDHPFWDGDAVQLATTGTLPAPLQLLTDYWIVGRADGTFKLSATEGGAAVNLTDGGSGTHTVTRRIPEFDSSVTAPTSIATPEATAVRSDGTVLFREPDGSWTSRILITLKLPGGLFTDIVGVEARFREANSSGPWSFASAERDKGEISLMPVEDATEYSWQLRWTLQDGTRGAWSEEATHTVEGKTAPPSDVTGFSAQQNGAVVTYRWSQIPDLDRKGYELRYGPQGAFDWDAAAYITRETKGTLVTNAGLPPGAWTIGLKAIDTSDNYSLNAATFDLTVVNQNAVISSEAFDAHWKDPRLPRIYGFDFMGDGALPDGASLTRASSGYDGSYIDANGEIRDAAANAPRWSHAWDSDEADFVLSGLLVEPERTNLMTQSANPFSWTKAGSAASNNVLTAPDGSSNGDLYTDNGDGTTNQVAAGTALTAITLPAADYYAMTGIFQPGTVTWALLRLLNFAQSPGRFFDLANLTAQGGFAPSGINADVTMLAHGWRRCVMTGDLTGAAADLVGGFRWQMAQATNNQSLLRNGTRTLGIWGGQVERCADGDLRASSFIRTVAFATTRAADVLTLTVPNGTYDVVIVRADGETTIEDLVVSGGSYTVPTSTSPLRSVYMISYAPGTADETKVALLAARPATVEDARPIVTGFVRHDVSGSLVPASQDTDSTADDIFDSVVPRVVDACSYRSPEIDVGHQASGLRVWATYEAEPGAGESGAPDITVSLDHRTSAGAYDGYEPWTVGTIEARYVQWQLDLVPTGVVTVLRGFEAVVDQVEREERHAGVAVAPGGTTLTYDEQYFAVPSVVATAQAASGAGRYAVWDNKSETSVDLFVFDAAGSDVGGTVDVTVKGA